MQSRLTMYTGPMFSGKTSTMCSRLESLSFFSSKCVLVRPDLDSRSILSHSGIIQTSDFTSMFNIITVKQLADVDISAYDYIGIDELQFFKDSEVVVQWRDMGKEVLVSCLSSNFERKMFPSIINVLPHCDDVIRLKSICRHCGEEMGISYSTAIYTKRMIESTEEILVGGSDMYEARCPKHFSL